MLLYRMTETISGRSHRLARWLTRAGLVLVFLVWSLPAVASHQDGLRAVEDGDYAKAFELWTEAAEAGDAVAQHNLAVLYQKGLGSERSYAKARHWFKAAAAQQYGPSFLALGLIYSRGEGVERDLVKSFDFVKQAADSGVAEAELQLAIMFAEGTGVQRNRSQSRTYFERALARGNEEAEMHLLVVDMVEWFEAVDGKTSIPTHLDDGTPLESFHYYLLGDAYRRGWWVPADQKLAVQLLKIGASKGSAKAAFLLGEAYEYGEGVTVDWHMAVRLYEYASNAGHIQAKYRLGLAQLYGTGAKEDAVSAYKNLALAAEAGEVGAGYLLAIAKLEHPASVSISDDTAVRYLHEAAAHGFVDALLALSVIYEKGMLGVSVDQSQSFKFALEAANKGKPGASHNVGVAYQLGLGTAPDHGMARRYFIKAAQNGFVSSAMNLAWLASEGAKDSDKDITEALSWLLVAASMKPSQDAASVIDQQIDDFNHQLEPPQRKTAEK